jgi:hypothetical protein
MEQTRPLRGEVGERFAAGRIFAPSLVGKPRSLAEAHAIALGFVPTVIGTSVESVTADVQPNRIRLRVDHTDTVIDAWPG